MENHTHQPYAPNPYQQPRPQQREYPQQNYSPVPEQPQQQSQTQQPSPSTKRKKKQGFTIASFIFSGIAYLPTLILFIASFVEYDGDKMGLALLLGILLWFVVPSFILASSILAILGITVNKTKSSIIALLVALIPTILIYVSLYIYTTL